MAGVVASLTEGEMPMGDWLLFGVLLVVGSGTPLVLYLALAGSPRSRQARRALEARRGLRGGHYGPRRRHDASK